MLPTSSSFTSSQSRPARGKPASAHRSTAASVCPRRVRTPPGRARKGTMCPGRVKSCSVGACRDMGAASARAVRARSCAEIPVVVPVCICAFVIVKHRRKWGAHTMFVVDRDGVCSPVSFLVLWNHHRDGQRLEAFTWQ
jgi:hypothetical protein